jgi:hypothetical protein
LGTRIVQSVQNEEIREKSKGMLKRRRHDENEKA